MDAKGYGATITRFDRHADTSCVCGQELDVCHHAYCPRCGTRVAGHSVSTIRYAAAC